LRDRAWYAIELAMGLIGCRHREEFVESKTR